MTKDASVDVVIVGSGPIGSAFARLIAEERPSATILLVEAGPQLTEVPGVHVRNIVDEHERSIAQLRSQGAGEAVGDATAHSRTPPDETALVPRPGTTYIDPERAYASRDDTLPAAAMSTNVGGMAAHWTCACPHPYGRERIPFIPDREWSDLLDEGRRLLAVTTDAFAPTRQGEAILRTLSHLLDSGLPEGRKVQRMPLACRIEDAGVRHWSGSDVVLGPLAIDPPETFELRAETVCRRILTDGDRATGVILHDRRSGIEYRVGARAVVAACDSFRTPQLLWASSIRPRALGHYLNDHVQMMGGVRMDEELVARITGDLPADAIPDARGTELDPIVGVFWIPYADDAHPFHSQIMHFDMSPLKLEGLPGDDGLVVGVGALIGKSDIRYEDCVHFSESELDAYGMPKMRISYGFTARDHALVEHVREQQLELAAALGSFAVGRELRTMPAGSSLHYQGTTRMAETDDGESVCDPHGRVWGFRNLFVGGNGVIPTTTAGNSTLTSVAVAVRSARALAADLTR